MGSFIQLFTEGSKRITNLAEQEYLFEIHYFGNKTSNWRGYYFLKGLSFLRICTNLKVVRMQNLEFS